MQDLTMEVEVLHQNNGSIENEKNKELPYHWFYYWVEIQLIKSPNSIQAFNNANIDKWEVGTAQMKHWHSSSS